MVTRGESMLEKLIELSLKYKILVIVAFIAISAFGFKAYQEIPVDAFPDITPKQVVIYTESPGNSAEDIEKLITYPIESAVSGMAGVKLIMSNSIFGLSYVSIFFEDDMDIYFLRQLVSERLTSVDIPKGWGKPVLGPNTTGLGQVFWYQVKDSTGKYSLREIKEMQKYVVTPLFKSVSGVEEVIGWGGDEKQYNVLIDTKKLQNFGITYSDIVDALQKSNQAAGGQYLEFNREQYLIRGAGLYKSLDDISNSVIKSNQGQSVTISDVATVETGTAPRFGSISIDGDEAVIGMVLQRTATNAAKVVERLKEKISTVNATLPKGVEIATIYDRTEITHKAVSTMTSALLSGIVLVAIVLFLFLFELRSAFIVIISLPLSLLIALELFIRKTRIGKSILAVSQDKEAAMLIGINVDRIYSLSMFISAVFAAFGGILYTQIYAVNPETALRVLIYAFAIVILGGLGNVRGSIFAAFIIGYLQVLTSLTLGARWIEIVAMVIIILILIIRPKGLFGVET